ncbi:MAG: YbhB/YbcL family Raf kinase inhibitor-like protein [Candidatus Methanofastidiosa archaeon]|nr:YbhB/YbcL family Raf kinase inhibitor-like protein [Candidatus Methanofastidiosa archaeon]
MGMKLRIRSDIFEDGGNIPSKYTCQGADINPPLTIEDVPEGTRSLALIMDDPDAPMGTWNHWLVWGIWPNDNIAEGSVPGIQGTNDFRQARYGGPCPPSGIHRYYFRIYALDTILNLKEGAEREELENAMDGHIIGKAELMGKYRRK